MNKVNSISPERGYIVNTKKDSVTIELGGPFHTEKKKKHARFSSDLGLPKDNDLNSGFHLPKLPMKTIQETFWDAVDVPIFFRIFVTSSIEKLYSIVII